VINVACQTRESLQALTLLEIGLQLALHLLKSNFMSLINRLVVFQNLYNKLIYRLFEKSSQ